jgi:site-specific recombinase XerD
MEIGDWHHKNPVENLKPLPLKKRTPFFLQLNQVRQLLTAANESRNEDLALIIKICLSIGCRWGEAQYLSAENVHNGKIHLQETKNGRARSIPIDKELERLILIDRPKGGALFRSAWKSFNLAIERADIQLPKGTATHVLRHTFASHFMMDGGDLLQLNKILGHETIEMTMRYAHLAPDHLESARRHNTLKQLKKERGTFFSGHNMDTIGNQQKTG